MLVPTNTITGWYLEAGANLALNTSTVKSGGASVEWDKTGTTYNYANVARTLTVPLDVASLWARKKTITYWTHHANYTNFTAVRMILAYDLSDPPVTADYYNITSLSANWNKAAFTISTPTSSTGTAAALAAGRLRGASRIIFQGLMGAAANIFSDLKVCGPFIEDAPYSLLLLGNNAADRVVLDSPLTPWNRRIQTVSHINAAEQAVETVFETAFEAVSARLRNVRTFSQRESLRRWAQYATRNSDWGVARDGRYMISTTVDAASGYSQADATILNVADTSEAEFIINDLGDDCWVAVHSLAQRTVEIAQVISIAAGVSLTLHCGLRNDYVSGDKVVSALADGTVNYIPAAALLNPMPLVETGQGVDLELEARWAT